jgi:hypothetical protein
MIAVGRDVKRVFPGLHPNYLGFTAPHLGHACLIRVENDEAHRSVLVQVLN